jgi:hypothetical protein
MKRSKYLLSKDDKDQVFLYGKYKWKTISEVYKIDPDYMIWFCCSPEKGLDICKKNFLSAVKRYISKTINLSPTND